MGSHISMRGILTALIVSLLLVPALARAQQSLDPGRNPAPSFSKSVDVPPDCVSIAPDSSIAALDVEALLLPVHGFVPAHAEALPQSPDLFDSDTLRGPPQY